MKPDMVWIWSPLDTGTKASTQVERLLGLARDLEQLVDRGHPGHLAGRHHGPWALVVRVVGQRLVGRARPGALATRSRRWWRCRRSSGLVRW